MYLRLIFLQEVCHTLMSDFKMICNKRGMDQLKQELIHTFLYQSMKCGRNGFKLFNCFRVRRDEEKVFSMITFIYKIM